MTPSPFHGIFNFNQPQDGSPAPTQVHHEPVEPAHTVVPMSAQQSGQVGQIAVDIYEMDDYFIIRAPIAGVKLSDLDIEVDDKVITISGMRQLPDSVPADQYYLQECFWGEFSRSVTLPISIDPKKVKATFSKSSILKILIPKEGEGKVNIVRINEG